MIIFVLNLYNATLELSDVGDRKLYTEAVKGINEAYQPLGILLILMPPSRDYRYQPRP